MRGKVPVLICAAAFWVMLASCAELRYSQVAPGIETFHPETICVLSVNPGVYEKEAGDVAGDLITDAVRGKGWFSTVLSPKDLAKLTERDATLRKAVADYLAKLKTVHFSDPDLSRHIGEACNADAFLVVDVNFWNYTTQGDDTLAKAGFSMELIEARTGRIMWKADHCATKEYTWFKPDLTSFARSVARDMIDQMPH